MKIVFLKTFLKDLQKVKDPKLARKLEQLILEIKTADSLEDLSNVKKMKGYSIAFRIRVGDYRVGIYKETEVVEFACFLKRNDIYKVFPK